MRQKQKTFQVWLRRRRTRHDVYFVHYIQLLEFDVAGIDRFMGPSVPKNRALSRTKRPVYLLFCNSSNSSCSCRSQSSFSAQQTSMGVRAVMRVGLFGSSSMPWGVVDRIFMPNARTQSRIEKVCSVSAVWLGTNELTILIREGKDEAYSLSRSVVTRVSLV